MQLYILKDVDVMAVKEIRMRLFLISHSSSQCQPSATFMEGQ